MKPLQELEARRLVQQAALDAAKTQRERNRLGQFATPPALARELMSYAVGLLPPDERIAMLDPACGTGAFFSALMSVAEPRTVASLHGFEIDPHYARPAQELWSDSQVCIEAADFTKSHPFSLDVNLLVSNPPYVRHHHLTSDQKARLQQAAYEASGMRLSGLAGFYSGLTQTFEEIRS